jgi:hypothetical protein
LLQKIICHFPNLSHSSPLQNQKKRFENACQTFWKKCIHFNFAKPTSVQIVLSSYVAFRHLMSLNFFSPPIVIFS